MNPPTFVDLHPMGMVARSTSCALVLLTAVGATVAGAPGASTSVVVQLEILSSTTLVNSCTSLAARGLGVVQPGGLARSATGADRCRLTFGSPNDTAQLRIGQSDGVGTAMGFGILPPTVLANDGAAGRTNGVFGYSSTLAFGAGYSSTVYRTSDGSTWGAPPGYTTHFDIEAVPGTPAQWWLVGTDRSVHRTLNATTLNPWDVSFTSQSAALAASGWPATVDLNELTIPDNDTIYIAGEARWIGKYDISAGTWTSFQHTNATFADLVAIDALSPSNAMAVSSDGAVLHTTTGATNSAGWSVTPLPGSPTQTTDIAIASSTRAYAVGLDGYLAVWDGTNWSDRSAVLALPRDIMGVDSIPGSPDSVVVVDGDGTVHRSDDAGLTWSHHPTGSASRAGDIHAATANDVYVVAAERSLSSSHDGGATWDTQGPTSSQELSGIDASPVDGRRLLAVGDSARRSTDTGANWTLSSTGVPGALRAVALIDDQSGWAVGDRAVILRTDDLGAIWTPQAAPPGVTSSLLDVTTVDEHRAVAVGFDGTILMTGNGGQSWSSRASGTTDILTATTSVADNVLAVGAEGTILRSSDAGVNWSSVPGGSMPDATADIIDVAFAGPDRAYAITRTSIWRSDDGGATWTNAGAVAGIRMRSIAASGSTVVVGGYSGAIRVSTDGGASFRSETDPNARHLGAVTMVDPHVALLAGSNAELLRMDVDTAADVLIPDWTPGSNDWDSGSFFGVCLQDVGGAAIADWTEDVSNVPGECEMLDSDPWRGVPAVASTAAHIASPGSGYVDLVWGMRTDAAQRPGTYESGVSFEVVAP